MYNCHILEECDTDFVLENILTKADSTAVFIDPPFGGRLEPLAYTLNKFDQIRKKCNKSSVSSKNIIRCYLIFFIMFFVQTCLIILLVFQSSLYYLISWNVSWSNVYLECLCLIIKLIMSIIKNLTVLVSILFSVILRPKLCLQFLSKRKLFLRVLTT